MNESVVDASTRIPGLLTSTAPGWTVSADVIVVGSGVAGLTTALRVRAQGLRVLLVTKATVDEGSTRWAQGGIAAALADDDSPEEHMADTLEAGGGLCNEEAVRILVTEGPDAVRELIAWGAHFDTDPTGSIALTREGGHHRNRIAHAGGDATGAEVSRALVEAVAADPGIELMENALVLDLIHGTDGTTAGVTLHVIGPGSRDGVGAALAPHVVLATGGFGQVFGQTTNPYVATGDGVALALRAGAAVADLEFVQFHPTVLWLGPLAQGQQPLVSEAVRGEGAVLVDGSGTRFMTGVHPLADLAPRDVVAKAIMRRMRETGAAHMWLDGRELGADTWVQRFPTILSACRLRGIDPVSDPIPVAPAQHYVSGGVITDFDGRSTIPGLYACGEVACSGVHGANRLASNSLLEGLVFARRIAEAIRVDERTSSVPAAEGETGGFPGVIANARRRALQQVMDTDVGVLRSAESLEHALGEIGATMRDPRAEGLARTEDWEATNLHTLAYALTRHAHLREETRGSHWREDHPQTREMWRQRLVTTMNADGYLQTTTHAPGWIPGMEEE